MFRDIMNSLANLMVMVQIMDGGWSQKDLSNFEAMIHSMTLYDTVVGETLTGFGIFLEIF